MTTHYIDRHIPILDTHEITSHLQFDWTKVFAKVKAIVHESFLNHSVIAKAFKEFPNRISLDQLGRVILEGPVLVTISGSYLKLALLNLGLALGLFLISYFFFSVPNNSMTEKDKLLGAILISFGSTFCFFIMISFFIPWQPSIRFFEKNANFKHSFF